MTKAYKFEFFFTKLSNNICNLRKSCFSELSLKHEVKERFVYSSLKNMFVFNKYGNLQSIKGCFMFLFCYLQFSQDLCKCFQI